MLPYKKKEKIMHTSSTLFFTFYLLFLAILFPKQTQKREWCVLLFKWCEWSIKGILMLFLFCPCATQSSSPSTQFKRTRDLDIHLVIHWMVFNLLRSALFGASAANPAEVSEAATASNAPGGIANYDDAAATAADRRRQLGFQGGAARAPARTRSATADTLGEETSPFTGVSSGPTENSPLPPPPPRSAALTEEAAKKQADLERTLLDIKLLASLTLPAGGHGAPESPVASAPATSRSGPAAVGNGSGAGSSSIGGAVGAGAPPGKFRFVPRTDFPAVPPSSMASSVVSTQSTGVAAGGAGSADSATSSPSALVTSAATGGGGRAPSARSGASGASSAQTVAAPATTVVVGRSGAGATAVVKSSRGPPTAPMSAAEARTARAEASPGFAGEAASDAGSSRSRATNNGAAAAGGSSSFAFSSASGFATRPPLSGARSGSGSVVGLPPQQQRLTSSSALVQPAGTANKATESDADTAAALIAGGSTVGGTRRVGSGSATTGAVANATKKPFVFTAGAGASTAGGASATPTRSGNAKSGGNDVFSLYG
jgi:hypothetical protein